MLSTAAPSAAAILLHADVGAVDVGFGFQNVLQRELLGFQGRRDLQLIEIVSRKIHLLDGQGEVFHREIVAVIGEAEPLGESVDRHACASGSLALRLGDYLGVRLYVLILCAAQAITQLPGRCNDVFLHGDERAALTTALLSTAATAALLVSSAKFLLCWNHLKKINI